MIDVKYINRHDLGPTYRSKIVDSTGATVDLTGATIVCSMKTTDGATLKINRQSTGITIYNQITNKGEFGYNWQAGDTDTSGSYYIEFEVNPGKITYPNPKDGKAKVVIKDDLDNV